MGDKFISSLARNALPSLESAPQTGCLSDEEVLDFASGRLQSTRYQEAHLHLDQCEVCQRLLSEAAHALATAETAPLPDSEGATWNTTFRPGALVGQRYLIRRFIARGGMGEVYEALDRDLQERVALKTVTSTACDNPRAVRLLKGEVQLSRRVSHPNVSRIYDFGTHVMPDTGAQISFLTMEFVDGETLGQRLRLGGALPVPEARRLARDMLRGLSAAHAAGVLHRDFKSDNVMLRADPGSDESSAVVLDFGLARALDHDSRGSVSNPGLVGTYGYLAPEQLQGRPHSPASDVYSFGVVWFEMLTGELPFESSAAPAVAALERLQRPAPAPSSKNPLVPAELDTVVLGCLRRSPKDRYRTPNEVLTAWDALDAQARVRFKMRAFIPLAIPAVLGILVGYLLVTNPKPRASADSAPVSSAKRSAKVAPPALAPTITQPALDELPTLQPSARLQAAKPSDPHHSPPLTEPTLAAKPEPSPSPRAAKADAPAPQQPAPQQAARPQPTQQPPQPPLAKPEPQPELQATASAPRTALGAPAWENPFASGAVSSATQLTGTKGPPRP